MSSRLGGGERQSLYFASKKSGDDVTALARLYLVVLVVDIVTHFACKTVCCCVAGSGQQATLFLFRKF